MTDIESLFIKYCPNFYFYKKEPYMPANFDDLLTIAGLTPETVMNDDVKLITIPKEKRFDVKLGTQILCKTSGYYTIKNIKYIDLIFTVTFSWNGTREEHSFDKEEVIVRVKIVNDVDDIVRVFGSAHGNGMWFNKEFLDFEDNKIIMYSANESHAMYNKPRLYKRIFGFGNDITGKDIKWVPSQFVIFNNDGSVKIIDKDKSIINPPVDGNYDYFKVNKLIGNEKNNQNWAGSIEYDTLNVDGYYKFQGGIDNLFIGPNKQVSKKIRIILRVVVILAWVGFLGYMIFRDVLNYKDNIYSVKELVLFILLHIFVVFCLFMTGTILGLDIFVLNPIYSD
jgi:hypothetical protein